MSVSIRMQKSSGPFNSKSFNEDITIVAKQFSGFDEVAIPAAKTGQLTTRTDNDTGVITLTGGHGLTNGTFDVHWGSGTTAGVRYGMTATIATNAMSVDGGGGDSLPTNMTNVTVQAPQTFDVDFDGDDLRAFAVYAAGKFHFRLIDDADAVQYSKLLVSANMIDQWYVGNGVTNPVVADNIAKILCSNGESSAAKAAYGVFLHGTPN